MAPCEDVHVAVELCDNVRDPVRVPVREEFRVGDGVTLTERLLVLERVRDPEPVPKDGVKLAAVLCVRVSVADCVTDRERGDSEEDGDKVSDNDADTDVLVEAVAESRIVND